MKLGDPIYMIDAEENGHPAMPDMYDRKWTAKTSYPKGAPASLYHHAMRTLPSPKRTSLVDFSLTLTSNASHAGLSGQITSPSSSISAGLAVYVLILAIAGFAEGVRGLPWWYQLLVAVTAITTPALLYVVNQTDPGIIPCSATKGARLSCAHMRASMRMRLLLQMLLQHLCCLWPAAE
jgi:hypothetical protein